MKGLISRLIILSVLIIVILINSEPLPEIAKWNTLEPLAAGTIKDLSTFMEPALPASSVSFSEEEQEETSQLLEDWGRLLGQSSSSSKESPAMTTDEFAEYMAYDLQIGTTTMKTLTKEAKDLNSDVVGWIYIPGTKINYPILFRKGSSNFYLNYNSKAKKSAAGAIFLDDTSKGKFSDLTVIHGHSMKDKTMFGSLLDYKTQSWANEHPTFYIFDGTYIKEYQVFACVVVNADNEDLVVGFNSKTARDLYYSRLIQRSLLDSVGISDPSDVVLLSTCSYEARNFRCLVYGSCIKKNGR